MTWYNFVACFICVFACLMWGISRNHQPHQPDGYKATRKDNAATAAFMHTTTEMLLASLDVIPKCNNAHLRTTRADSVQHCASPQTSNPDPRYWLPGPPPRRRIKELKPLENLPCVSHRLAIPVRKVNLWSFQNRTSTTLAPYFDAREAASSLDFSDLVTTERYLFHGCANEISPALLESFSRYGPSIYFSRPQSYFSRMPAVYWTTSLDFAFAWCIFSETGQWEPNLSPETTPFECLIYVSRVKQNILSDESHCYMVPTPSNCDEEQQLVKWCELNMTKSGKPGRVRPPYSTRSDWPLIGSRIPQHTMDSLTSFNVREFPALGTTRIQDIIMYAACDENMSYILASAGIEILHLVSPTLSSHRSKL